ncbi:hypothetical protein BDK51DRAFT_37618 [Blyttiomyces helicus]|uniref:Uncharacterized protein n=1 Tax=Blyttiomyces helicus TaxID=388810 RepID=A0A4P9VWF6_9FUNG|nr:hypothetical protein BDK51DRAFT_37618 [Blyttiomyces helicus]|eukprot:RKO84031.1 hypothetical protein BDK51DRAFT_37618 [Blyttiomyces helicus]
MHHSLLAALLATLLPCACADSPSPLFGRSNGILVVAANQFVALSGTNQDPNATTLIQEGVVTVQYADQRRAYVPVAVPSNSPACTMGPDMVMLYCFEGWVLGKGRGEVSTLGGRSAGQGAFVVIGRLGSRTGCELDFRRAAGLRRTWGFPFSHYLAPFRLYRGGSDLNVMSTTSMSWVSPISTSIPLNTVPYFVTVGSKGYILGGLPHHGIDVWSIDFSYSTLPPPANVSAHQNPTTRSHACAAQLGQDGIFFCGGGETGSAGTYFGDAYIYNISVGGDVYLFGGMIYGEVYMIDIWKFSHASLSWTRILEVGQAVGQPAPRAYASVASHMGYIAVTGGLW